MNLLIVDDESQNRKLLEVLLQHEGYLTLSAANGEEAVAEVARGRGSVYDPVVADACLKLFRDWGYVIPA